MIVKELDTFVSGDALAKTGRKAEESLAHYLGRAFKDSPGFLATKPPLTEIMRRFGFW